MAGFWCKTIFPKSFPSLYSSKDAAGQEKSNHIYMFLHLVTLFGEIQKTFHSRFHSRILTKVLKKSEQF